MSAMVQIFHELKDGMFHSTRRSRVEWNKLHLSTNEIFALLHEWKPFNICFIQHLLVFIGLCSLTIEKSATKKV